MASLFTKIITGEAPGRFVWNDPEVVAFLTIAPLTPGHTLVVPRREIDQWTDTDAPLLTRCLAVAQQIGVGVKRAFNAPRAGLVIAGFEVPHLHVHVFPTWSMADFDWSRAERASAADLDDAADRLRQYLPPAGAAG